MMIHIFPEIFFSYGKIFYVILKGWNTASPFYDNFKHFSFYINSGIIQYQTKLIGYIKEPHISIFIGQTECGKTHLVLELIEKEYNKHFGFIIIICPTLRENDTYHSKEWIKNDNKVKLEEPRDWLYEWNKKLSELLRFLKVLSIIDDIIANRSLNKRRQPLLELSISGRHRGHYFWLLTVVYCYTKKLKKTGQGHICVVCKGKDRS